MMENNKQAGDQGSAPADGFDTRRTVVKGIASAVPVIMTVGSGEVLANASSLQCIKQPTSQPDKCIGKNDRDTWLRKWKNVKVGRNKYEKKQCLVYVDESGDFVSKKNGTPVTQSCYCSFVPGKTK
ncbi:MAG: hypothetical protein GY753_09145 [Gammaproteobacteria bacterium]|nr:hypothetical protein [Gammaproteobacteria bacterium]